MRRLIIIAFALLGKIGMQAQEFGLGLRDNQYVRADYIGKFTK